jgi:hypothetical protein
MASVRNSLLGHVLLGSTLLLFVGSASSRSSTRSKRRGPTTSKKGCGISLLQQYLIELLLLGENGSRE